MQQPEVPPSFLSEHWRDIVNVAGVVISIVGFAVTIIGVRRSKKAAERAEESVREVKETMLRADTMAELSTAVAIMDEIKRLHRATAWNILLDRYSSVKKILVAVRSSNADLHDDYKALLQGSIQQFTDIEKKVERALASNSNFPNVATLNDITSAQVDKINEVIAALRQNIGMERYERQ